MTSAAMKYAESPMKKWDVGDESRLSAYWASASDFLKSSTQLDACAVLAACAAWNVACAGLSNNCPQIFLSSPAATAARLSATTLSSWLSSVKVVASNSRTSLGLGVVGLSAHVR